jgi:hypothetical protein
MNCWESFFIHVLQQRDVLIEEHMGNDLNPLYVLDHVTRLYTTSHDAYSQFQFTLPLAH